MSNLKINETLEFEVFKDHSTTEIGITENNSISNYLIVLKVNKGNIMHNNYSQTILMIWVSFNFYNIN